jgi:hypothetical protein
MPELSPPLPVLLLLRVEGLSRLNTRALPRESRLVRRKELAKTKLQPFAGSNSDSTARSRSFYLLIAESLAWT